MYLYAFGIPLRSYHTTAYLHYNDVIMARWRLIWPTSTMFTQPFIQVQIKENIKAPRHWPLRGNSPVTGEFPAQMASNAENVSIWWRHHDLGAGQTTQIVGRDWIVQIHLSNNIISITERNNTKRQACFMGCGVYHHNKEKYDKNVSIVCGIYCISP